MRVWLSMVVSKVHVALQSGMRSHVVLGFEFLIVSHKRQQ